MVYAGVNVGRLAAVSLDLCERLAVLGQDGVEAPRLLVVLAHADDEVLALGGRLEWLGASRFLTVTDGVPVDGVDARAHGFAGLAEYGTARRAELKEAFAMGGLDPACARSLEIDAGRVVSDQGAAVELVKLARALAQELAEFRPDAVLTHPYEGGHPDHDACAFAVHAAVRVAEIEVPTVEAPFYHAGSLGIETGVFVSGDAGIQARLTEAQAARKRERLACFRSQRETLAPFGVDAERYRAAPGYDFLRRPHEGQLYYEQFPWGMDGERFCGLAARAMEELGL